MDTPTPASRESAALRHLRTAFSSVPVRRTAFWCALAAVLVLSLLPRAAVDAVFSGEIQEHDHKFHAFSYFALSSLFLCAHVRRGRAVPALRAAVFAFFSLLGGALELAQATPWINRSATSGDALNNAAGAAAGALLPAFFLLPGRKAGSDVPS